MKDGTAVLFCFQILLSHHNNHLSALYGLAAASDVKGERERERGGAHAAGQYIAQRSTLVDLPPLLPALPYRSVTDCAHSVRSTAKLGLYQSDLTQTAKLGLYRSTAKLSL